MRSLIVSLLLMFAVVAFAAAPTYIVTASNYEWQLEKSFPSANDTLSGTTDSILVFTKYAFTPGWEYGITKPKQSGADTTVIYRLDYYDDGGVFIRSVNVDTAKSAGKDIMLPIYRTDWAARASLVGVASTIGGAASEITTAKTFKLWKRRAVPVTSQLR